MNPGRTHPRKRTPVGDRSSTFSKRGRIQRNTGLRSLLGSVRNSFSLGSRHFPLMRADDASGIREHVTEEKIEQQDHDLISESSFEQIIYQMGAYRGESKNATMQMYKFAKP